MHEQLAKIYEMKSEDLYHLEYEKRFNDVATVKLPLSIQSSGPNEEFQCFYVPHQTLISDYDRILRADLRIRQAIQKLPDALSFQYCVDSKLMDELINTNRIEGIRSAQSEMVQALKEVRLGRKVKYSNLMAIYLSLTDEDCEIKINEIADIKKIHNMLVFTEIDLDEDELEDEDTEADEEVDEESLAKLITFLNDYDAPALYKIAVAHYYFDYLHSDDEVNGRVSRFISSLYLRKELDILTALTLSYAIQQNKKIYYGGLDGATNDLNKGELTHFCQAFFKILHDAQKHVLNELSKKQKLFKNLISLLDTHMKGKTENEKTIVLVMGKHYIFASVSRMWIIDLEAGSTLTPYRVSKALVTTAGFIDIVGRKPKILMLTEAAREFINN